MNDMSEIVQGVLPPGLRQSFADERTQPFWDNAREGKLTAPRCDACGTFILPPKPYCYECLGQAFTWTELAGTGTIYTFIVVRHPLQPAHNEVVPYVSGIIDLDGTQGAGCRLVGNIIGCVPEDVEIGDPVRVEFEPLGDDYAMMRFRWLGSSTS
jgi:uncharacterized OB-fold protein